MVTARSALEDLNARIVACKRCERLRAYCAEVARVRVLALGLAPGAHGSNRTGRMFTGDGSGYFFYPLLHEAGFASQPLAVSRDDGMKLTDLWISALVRCAPPGNKPAPEEQRNCAPYLDEEIGLLKELRVVVCLGKIAFDGFLAHARRSGQLTSRSGLAFAHSAEFTLPNGLALIASYHPSLQNTNTGKLTRPMLLEIFKRVRKLAGLS